MARQAIGNVPADAAHDGHGDSFILNPIPGSKGNRYEIEDEKSEFIAGDIVQYNRIWQETGENESPFETMMEIRCREKNAPEMCAKS